MIILIILFITISIFLIEKYFSIREKIMCEYISPEGDKNYNHDFAKMIIKIRKDIFDFCTDSYDSLFTKEEMFKFYILKNFILRGFYNVFSLKQILVVYDILKEKGENNLSNDFWIELWAQDILKDICNNINVFTFIKFRYKIGRKLITLFFNLDTISRNFCLVKDFYGSNLEFIKDTPRQMKYIIKRIEERKEAQTYFINFYEIDDLDVWYREKWI